MGRQIAVVFTIAPVMTWAATQLVAFRLSFQPQLGTPWVKLVGLPGYSPQISPPMPPSGAISSIRLIHATAYRQLCARSPPVMNF